MRFLMMNMYLWPGIQDSLFLMLFEIEIVSLFGQNNFVFLKILDYFLLLYLPSYLGKCCSSTPFFYEFSRVIDLDESMLFCDSIELSEFFFIVVVGSEDGKVSWYIFDICFDIFVVCNTGRAPVSVEKEDDLSFCLSNCC